MGRALLPEQDATGLLIDEIICQIDKHRGEMSRLEFVNLLIRNQLEKYRNNRNHTDEEEIYYFIKEVMEMLASYLEFFCKIKLSNITAESQYCSVEEC